MSEPVSELSLLAKAAVFGLLALSGFGCNLILGIDSIEADVDAGPQTVATALVQTGETPRSGTTIFFHGVDGIQLAEEVTGADGIVEFPTSDLVVATMLEQGIGFSRMVGPGELTKFRFLEEFAGTLEITAPAGPANTAEILIEGAGPRGNGFTVSELGGTRTITRILETALRPGGELVDALAFAKDTNGINIGVTLAIGVPRQPSLTQITLPSPYLLPLSYEVRGAAHPIEVRQVLAERSYFVNSLPAVQGVGTTFGLAPQFGSEVQVEVTPPTASGRFYRRRLPFDANGVSIPLDWENSLANVTGASIATTDGITFSWDPYPSRVELASVFIQFGSASAVEFWFVQAPADLGAFRLPDIASAQPDAPMAIANLSVLDFSGHASYSEYLADFSGALFPNALLPAVGEQVIAYSPSLRP